MKLRTKIILLLCTIFFLFTTCIGLVGNLVIDETIYGMNTKLMNLEMNNLIKRIKNDHALLERSGLANIPGYLEQTERELVQNFNDYSFGTTGQLHILAWPGREVFSPTKLTIPRETLLEMFKQKSGVNEYGEGPNRKICSYQIFPEWNWLVILSVSKSEVFLNKSKYFNRIVLLASGLILLGCLIMGLYLSRVGNRIRNTLLAVKTVEGGNLKARVENIRSSDEFTELQLGINSMIGKIEKRAQEIHSARENLEKSEERYRGIYENSIEGIFQSTLDGKYLAVNPSQARILGYETPEELMSEVTNIGTQVYQHRKDRERLIALLLESGSVNGIEFEARRRGGERIWLSFAGRIVRDEFGSPMCIEGFNSEITKRKEAEENLADMNYHLEQSVKVRTMALAQKAKELAEANTRLVEMDELKSSFLSSVSHELRTPLTSILGFAKLISRDFIKHFKPISIHSKITEKSGNRIIENLKVISKEGERLARLVNDVLDLNRIESGRMEWRDSELLPREFILEAVSVAKGEYSRNPKLTLVVEDINDLPPVRADKDKMVQVMVNLLNNAAKFTEKGKVTVTATLDGDMLQISVSDTGTGISTDNILKIFDKFQQIGGDTLKEKPQGTGLGLAISKQIVTHYKGRIWVDSTPGQGSVFTFTLPVSSTEHPGVQPETAIQTTVNSSSGLIGTATILVVDDDPAINQYLTQVFEAEGFNVFTAMDGESALSRAKECQPDLITMDIMMPRMDGHTAINWIRMDHELKDIPVLIISVLAEEDDIADASLTKPIDEKKLLDTVRSLLNQGDSSSPMLILRRNGPEDIGSLFTLCSGKIVNCTEAELWDKLAQGFEGTVLLPPWAAKDLDVKRLGTYKGVQVLLLPEKPPVA